MDNKCPNCGHVLQGIEELKNKIFETFNDEIRQRDMYKLAFELVAKYGISADEPQGVCAALLDRDKYLDLAYAMNATRNDWSQGYWRVEEALARFKEQPQSEQDKAIIADIQSCLDESWVDGRTFRDTEWNYSRLYEVVKPELFSDFQSLYALLFPLPGYLRRRA